MRDRKPTKIAEQKPTNVLRRSPRFLQQNLIAVENPGTPNSAARKLSAPDSFSTPFGSCITKIQENGDGISQNGRRKDTKLKTLEKSSKGSRRSARFEHGADFNCLDLQKQYVIQKRVTRSSIGGSKFVNSQSNECGEISGKKERGITELRSSKKSGKGSNRNRANVTKSEEALFPQKQYLIEKRVTRSSVRGNKVVMIEISDSDSEEDSGESARIFSKERKPKVGVDSCKKNIGNIEKRVTRSSNRKKKILLVEKGDNAATNSQQEVIMSDEIKHGGDDELSKLYTNTKDVKFGVTMRSGDRNCKRKTCVGEKRKRYQVEEECEIAQGWTKEQELALRRAYFTAKPTPQFWKEVARMVPGKSTKECFDRIHSDYLTPSQPRTRSRAKKKEPSPITFSASKLLSPAEMKSKKLTSRRRRTLVAHKTVRQLLQKQHNDDQDYEADLFAVLEPLMDSSPLNFQEGTPFASPAPNQRQMSSSAQRKQRSRLSSSHKAAFVSPPVLKQIKNKALHEKYIDQLHCRDAKRKAAALRSAKNVKDQIDEKVSLLKLNLVKVAKDALVSDAQDAINQLRNLQSGTNYSTDDDDSTCLSDENDDEDELR